MRELAPHVGHGPRPQKLPYPVRHIAGGDDRVAQRNAVAVMAGEEQPGRLPLDVGHQLTVAAVADVILRDRLRIKHAVLEGRLALHAQQHAQVFARQREQLLRRQRRQLRVPLAPDVAGQRQMPRRRAVGKERRGEDGAQDLEALDFRYQHAKPCARMRHVLAPEPQHDAGHRRIANLREGREVQRHGRLDLQFRQPEGRARVNHRAVLGARLLAALAQVQRPAFGRLGEAGDGGVEAHRLAQALAQGIGQHLQPLVKGELGGAVFRNFPAPLALARAEDLPLDERAVARLKLAQLRERLRHRELVRVARIHPGDERINGMVQKLLPEPAHHKLGDALLLAIAARRHERLAQHGQLGPRA